MRRYFFNLCSCICLTSIPLCATEGNPINTAAQTYSPKVNDPQLYSFWEEHHFFNADLKSDKTPFCLVMTPPNVSEELHMGHALENTLEDIIIRWKRMLGYNTLWVPAIDHAGIATEAVVERLFLQTDSKKKSEVTREEFLQKSQQLKEQNQAKIIKQLKSLGCSCDWSHLRYTMDKAYIQSVRTLFKRLYQNQLVFRAERFLKNWDPILQTALSDDEVEHKQMTVPRWSIQYPLKDGSGSITIQTMHPEFLLGETAIAVSPTDARYKDFIGKTVVLPLINREIPIIGDTHVDPKYGSGAMAVAPLRDEFSYQIGQTHHLSLFNIMTANGKINQNGDKYAGLPQEEARQAIVKDLTTLGLIKDVEQHKAYMAYSPQTNTIVQPYFSKQWFVKMDPFISNMRTAVQDSEIKFIPSTFQKNYFHWLDRAQDWCISRQLWWGIQIPVWYHKDDPQNMICYEGEGLPEQVKANPQNWIQDTDTLDSWFTGSLWPFAALGWPEATSEFNLFYPNAFCCTGSDIMFLDAARMIQMGQFATGNVPFSDYYIHGMIYAKANQDKAATNTPTPQLGGGDKKAPTTPPSKDEWVKMAKAANNTIDPETIINQYGADSLRQNLCINTNGPKINIDMASFEKFKDFNDIIWKGTNLLLTSLDASVDQQKAMTAAEFSTGLDKKILAAEDKWLLANLNQTVNSVNENLARYNFKNAALQTYNFIAQDCVYYVSITKPILSGKVGNDADRRNKQKLMSIVLCQAVRLMHPIAPFITEEIFQILKKRLDGAKATAEADPYTIECITALQSAACIVAPYPQVPPDSDRNAYLQ